MIQMWGFFLDGGSVNEKGYSVFFWQNEILINNIELSATLLRILFFNALERNVPETSSASLKNIPLVAYSFS